MKRPLISLLVPFRANKNSPHRARIWNFLRTYWSWELPDAEIVIGRSKSRVFSKTEAVNDAARRARGRVLVILDSDVYLRGEVILKAARDIEEAARKGHNLWFVPYRRLYRLTESASELVLSSNPVRPKRFPSPPDKADVESMIGSGHAHHYGAMIQILPRAAFFAVGGMDVRFCGWGSEDVSFVYAVDTLWGKHKTLKADILHLWHPVYGKALSDRAWEDQGAAGGNGNLGMRYSRARGDVAKMRALVDEGLPPPKRHWLARLFSWLVFWR